MFLDDGAGQASGEDADLFSAKFLSAKICVICGRFSVCEIEIRAAHEIMAARTTQLALLVDQLMSALQAKPPMLAGNVFVRRRGTGVGRFCFGLRITIGNSHNQPCWIFYPP